MGFKEIAVFCELTHLKIDTAIFLKPIHFKVKLIMKSRVRKSTTHLTLIVHTHYCKNTPIYLTADTCPLPSSFRRRIVNRKMQIVDRKMQR